jgi:alpha-D-ribose 1-methylphosphonate 5-triphosphate synthase subunit PhnG
MAVTVRDADGRIAGTGTVVFTWRQATRVLASVHATDATSSVQGAQRRTALGAALLCASLRAAAEPSGAAATAAGPAD